MNPLFLRYHLLKMVAKQSDLTTIFAMKEDYQLLTNKVGRGLWGRFASFPSYSTLQFSTVKTIALPGGAESVEAKFFQSGSRLERHILASGLIAQI